MSRRVLLPLLLALATILALAATASSDDGFRSDDGKEHRMARTVTPGRSIVLASEQRYASTDSVYVDVYADGAKLEGTIIDDCSTFHTRGDLIVRISACGDDAPIRAQAANNDRRKHRISVRWRVVLG